MNQRLAIAISGVAAVAVLTVGAAAAGLTPVLPGSQGVVASGSEAEVQATEVSADITAEPTIKPRTVYVKPAPKRKTVVVTKAAPQRATKAGKTTTKASRSTRAARQRRAERNHEHDDDRHEREDREDHEDHEDREDKHDKDDD